MCKEEKEKERKKNIAFARGGAHLPIAHALRLLSKQELRFGLTKLKFRKKRGTKFSGYVMPSVKLEPGNIVMCICLQEYNDTRSVNIRTVP